ncbi:MAG: tripartite tricarboxylate transporter substrate binding protein, partial [Rhodoferax sp.]|nr:tripartite tricarboxylate transporter substrate binding protein [Rhodoferax sp.]
MFKRQLVLGALGAAAITALPLAAFAQTKTTRIVISFPPGGPVDFVARSLAEQLGKELGQTVIIDNRAGANGAIGAGEVIRSSPDGHTLWFTSVGAAAINPSLYDKLAYDTQRDLAPVSLVANNVELLVVNPANPARDAAEFVANSKKRKDPTPMASTGIGSIPHFAIEQLSDASGAKLMHVPYKGAAPAITDLMGGQVDGFFGDIPGLIGHVRAGKLKAMGLASTRRHPALPDVKTLAEQGIANVDTNNWYALFAPVKTPAGTVQ